MKDREIQCIHYINHLNCGLGRSAELHGYCQKCDKYAPKPGAHPARTDRRRKTLDKIDKKEQRDY